VQNINRKLTRGGMLSARRGPRRSILLFVPVMALLASTSRAVPPDSNWIHDQYRAGDFKIVEGVQTADVLTSPADYKVVAIAAQSLADDIQRVTGKTSTVRTEPDKTSAYAIIIGTLGKSPLIDSLASAGKLSVGQLRGTWESFLITTVPRPL